MAKSGVIPSNQPKVEEVKPGPASSAYVGPKDPVIPEIVIKKRRYYCEACSHTTDITEDHIKDKLPVKCGSCQKVNRFQSKNILPV